MGSRLLLTGILIAVLAACGGGPGREAAPEASGGATSHTVEFNRALARSLPLEEMQSFEDARRGFIASLSPLTIKHSRADHAVYDLSGMGFLEGEAPDSVGALRVQ